MTRGEVENINTQRPSSYNGKALKWFHQHRKYKAHKNPVWMKDLNCLTLLWPFWECVQKKEYSFTHYHYQYLGFQVQISTSFIANTHFNFTDLLPLYNFLFTLLCVVQLLWLKGFSELKDHEAWVFLQVAGGREGRQMQKKCYFSEPEKRLQKIIHIIISSDWPPDWPPANFAHFIGWLGQGLLSSKQLVRRHMIRQASLERKED